MTGPTQGTTPRTAEVRVPYLSALTRPASGQPALRPPRRLFAEEASQTVQAGQAPAAPDVLTRLTPAGPERPAAAPPPPPRPAFLRPEPSPAAADVTFELTGLGVRQPEPPTPPTARLPATPMTVASSPADPGQPANVPPAPGLASRPAPDDVPRPPRPPEISTIAVPGGPPQSWADPRWALPAELPQVLTPKDSPGPVRPLEPGHPAGQSAGDRHQRASILTPSPPDSDEIRLSEPGAVRRRARTGGSAQLSIGTIEVTVVPPAPPAAPPPPQPVRRDRPRPVSTATASPAADRLRDGLRRWHGTAQG